MTGICVIDYHESSFMEWDTQMEEQIPASLRRRELDIRTEELALRKAELAIEFAKFGFRGTLTGAIVGMALAFGLAVLDATTEFAIGGWAIVGIFFMVLLGVIVFGYLSLRQPIKMAAKFWDKMSLEFDRADRGDTSSQ